MISKLPFLPAILGAAAVLVSYPSETRADTAVVVSVQDQQLAVIKDGQPVATFPVSTSKFGLSDRLSSYGTPLGTMQVAQKIGDGAPIGSVFKHRQRTGEVLRPNAPGRDPIVTRIIWLRGTEPQNARAYDRGIYIHGTAEERKIGRPASYGCIRMKSADVVRLYDALPVGARVEVVNSTLRSALRVVNSDVRTASHEG